MVHFGSVYNLVNIGKSKNRYYSTIFVFRRIFLTLSLINFFFADGTQFVLAASMNLCIQIFLVTFKPLQTKVLN